MQPDRIWPPQARFDERHITTADVLGLLQAAAPLDLAPRCPQCHAIMMKRPGARPACELCSTGHAH